MNFNFKAELNFNEICRACCRQFSDLIPIFPVVMMDMDFKSGSRNNNIANWFSIICSTPVSNKKKKQSQ